MYTQTHAVQESCHTYNLHTHTETLARPLLPFPLFVTDLGVQFTFPQKNWNFPRAADTLGTLLVMTAEEEGSPHPRGTPPTCDKVWSAEEAIHQHSTSTSNLSVNDSDNSQTQRCQRHVSFGSMKTKQIALWLAADDMFAKTSQTGTLRATTGCKFTSKNQTTEIMLRLTRVEVFSLGLRRDRKTMFGCSNTGWWALGQHDQRTLRGKSYFQLPPYSQESLQWVFDWLKFLCWILFLNPFVLSSRFKPIIFCLLSKRVKHYTVEPLTSKWDVLSRIMAQRSQKTTYTGVRRVNITTGGILLTLRLMLIFALVRSLCEMGTNSVMKP